MLPHTRRGRANGLQQTKKYAALNASHVQANAKAERADQLAKTDSMTGLLNRRGLDEKFEELLELNKNISPENPHRRQDDRLKQGLRSADEFALLFIDLDGLKPVNDGFGHTVGDEAIKFASALISKSVRSNDIVARVGGDEFVVVLPVKAGMTADKGDDVMELMTNKDLEPLDVAAVVAEKIRSNFANDKNFLMATNGMRFDFTTSIGCAALEQSDTLGRLIEKADMAAYKAKGKAEFNSIPLTVEGTPKNRVAFFIPGAPEPILAEKYSQSRTHGISYQAPTVAREMIQGRGGVPAVAQSALTQ